MVLQLVNEEDYTRMRILNKNSNADIVRFSNADIIRFRGISIYDANLIIAEEKFLKSSGWEVVDRNGIDSLWKHSAFTPAYSRNHAVLVEKARNLTVGYW